jgi:mono/diheme cytochrome c family protein
MRWTIVMLLLILTAGCAGQENMLRPAASAGATPPRRFSEGEALYIGRCAGCHGWEGRGDGPVARVMGIQPPGLRGRKFEGRYTEAELIARILFGDAMLIFPEPARLASNETAISDLVAHLKRLPQIDWENVVQGRETYDSLCASCHGVYGRGDGILASAQASPPRDLRAPSFQLKTTDEELLRVIAEGKGNMPGAKDVLTPEEIRPLAAYVRVLSPGYESYERFCARCHGSDGYPPADSSNGIFGVFPFSRQELIGAIFDEDYFRAHSDSAVRAWVERMYKADHSLMPRFGTELNGDDVRKILGYLRGLPEGAALHR